MAQTTYEVPLVTEKDYSNAEKKVIEAATFLLSTKFDNDNLERLYATEFVMKWMAGTPHFTFQLNEQIARSFAEEPELMNLYMAAMAKYALENKNKAADTGEINLQAAKALIEYTARTANNLRQTGELKKMAAAMKKGELRKFMGI
jgi:hypothetical protein